MKKKNIACCKLDVTGRGQCLGDIDFDDAEFRVATGQGKVREIQGQGKVREF